MTKRNVVWISSLGLVIGLFTLSWLWRSILAESGGCASVSKQYVVHFDWGPERHRIQLLDAETKKEETRADLRAVGEGEATPLVAEKLAKAGLKRAKGQFRMALIGCGKPYLVSFSSFEISDLGRFMTAAQSWDKHTIEGLIEDFGPGVRDPLGRTPLIWAAADPTVGVPREVLTNLTDPPDIGTVRFLLDRGADPNAADYEGITALMRASGSTVGMLLAAGADLKAKDHKGRTALIHAVAWVQDIETVKALLAAGADVHAKDAEGKTVLQYAHGRGREDIVALLKQAGAKE